MNNNRVILIVLDSVGIGALPDADLYGDLGSNTLGNIALHYPTFNIPNLIKLGLGNIDLDNKLKKSDNIKGAYGKAKEQSAGKDTTTGHWEIAGTVLNEAFPSFTNGFPKDFMDRFEEEIGIKTLGNIAASGTVIINELGQEHINSNYPIVYTSADSVFQIAMHEEVYTVDQQYEICKIARKLLTGPYEVGRVIARPFIGNEGNFTRTSNRKDFSLQPPDNLLTAICKDGQEVIGVGKIVDIFSGKGISRYIKTKNNLEGITSTIREINKKGSGLIFTNLVDFDMLYGHRRNIVGYAKCLEEFDLQLEKIIASLKQNDLLMITADHGNDPSFKGSDHTREYVPILCYGNTVRENINFGERESFADMAATIAEFLDIELDTPGKSFLKEIRI